MTALMEIPSRAQVLLALASDRDFTDFLSGARSSSVSWAERPWMRASEMAQVRYQEDSERLLVALRSESIEQLQEASQDLITPGVEAWLERNRLEQLRTSTKRSRAANYTFSSRQMEIATNVLLKQKKEGARGGRS